MKRLAALFLLALTLLGARAEVHYKPHISIGGHAGVTLSRVTFSPQVEQRWVQGMCAGVSARYAEEKLVGVVGEVNISQMGWGEFFEIGSPLRYWRHITYATIPVMTHIYFGPPRFKCFFNLGPQIGLVVGESTSANFDYHNPTASEHWPETPRMTEQLVTPVKNKFDYGITAGFGCEFWLRPRHSIYVEGRFYYGLGNIFPATKADTFSASRNMQIAVTLGYNFRLK